MTRTATGLTMPAALLLALAAFFAFAALAGAESQTGPITHGTTPKSFGDSCNGIKNSELIEITDPNGAITSSHCTINGSEHSCNWVEKTCTSETLEPTSGGVGRVPVDGVLVDDSPGAAQPESGFGGVAAPPGDRGAVLDDER